MFPLPVSFIDCLASCRGEINRLRALGQLIFISGLMYASEQVSKQGSFFTLTQISLYREGRKKCDESGIALRMQLNCDVVALAILAQFNRC